MPNPNLSTNIHEKEAAKSSQKSRNKKLKLLPKWQLPSFDLLKDPKFIRILGLFLLLLAAYLFVAFTSFLFTWQIDFDKVNHGWLDLIFDSESEIDNWLGKFGAIISHFFIYESFGIAAFIFPFLSFLLSFKILFKKDLLPLKSSVKNSLFILFWLPVVMSFIFYEANHLLFLGGYYGLSMIDLLIDFMGKIGTVFLLLFVVSTYSIINFNFSLASILPKFNTKAKQSNSDEALNNYPVATSEQTDSMEEATSEKQIINETTAAPNAQNEKESLSNIELTIEDEKNDNSNKESDEDEDEDEDEDDAIPSNIELELPEELALEEEGELTHLEVENETENEDIIKLDVEAAKADDSLSKSEIRDLAKEFGQYDPTLELSNFKFPDINLLKDHGDGQVKVNKEELEANKNRIVETLSNYNIQIEKIKANVGPTVTLYEIVPAKGVRISKIKNLEDDIALSLAALGIRIIAPIPGKGTIGIEVPNQNPDIVSMRTVISSQKFQNTDMALPIALGKTISNETFITDLAKMPHLLMAGATGQGKSVGLNAILVSLLYKKHPSQIKFVLVDPKKVELTLFNKIERHYLAKLPDEEEPIITDTSKVVSTLNSLCTEMDDRYELLKDAQVRNLKEYNAKFVDRKLNPENGHRYLPYIVLVVDEFADLIMTAGKEVEVPISRLAQLARAIGIHLIIATQRPSVNIITGTIKANFPSRIAFRVTAKIDSRTILDTGGADQLIGRGDMLFSNGSELIRLQCAFVDTPEVEEICEYIGNQKGYASALLLPEDNSGDNETGAKLGEDLERDALFEDAARVVVIHQQGSASLLQRKLKLGYNRAGRIIDQLEAAGIIGPFEGSKARQVLIPDESSLERLLNSNA